MLYLLALLTGVLLFVSRAEGAPRLPDVREARDLAWVRQPIHTTLSPWDLDPVLFPSLSKTASAPAPVPGPASAAADLLAAARRKADEAGARGNDPRIHEEAAHLYMRAFAVSKNGETGIQSLSLAARSYFLAGRYAEADGAAGRLIARSGGGRDVLPYYLLKGEALLRRGNYLAARECYRRASAAKTDGDTGIRISLRIADASLLLGNLALAEPLYRKIFSSPGISMGKFRDEAIRYGETLLAVDRAEEALQVFRRIQKEFLPGALHVKACIGEGDALLVMDRLPRARYAYEQANLLGEMPETKWRLLCRKADIDFAEGKRKEAAAAYRELRESPDLFVAEEARYKWILHQYLLRDYEGTVKESQEYLLRSPGRPGSSNVRLMAAKAGAELVREMSAREPSKRWAAFSSLLFSFARSGEGRSLYGDIGKEWEGKGFWGGAGAFYSAAGNEERSREMIRIEAAEAAYFRGDGAAVLAALGYSEAQREKSPVALWLAAKTLFRQGRHAKASEALQRLDVLSPEPPETGWSPRKELAAFAGALQEKREVTRDSVREFRNAPPVSSLAFLADWAEEPSGASPYRVGKDAGKGKKPAGDAWSDLAAARRRYLRLTADGDE